ncbi:MAG: glycosyltransferase [Actinomycetota bacterium]
MNACTVTTKRRLPFARVLGKSFLEHHPEASFTVLVADVKEGGAADESDGFQFLFPSEVGISQDELGPLAMLAQGEQLRFALAPRLILSLLGSTGGPQLFISDDALVLASLHEVELAVKEHDTVVGRRAVDPFPSDNRTPTNDDLLNAGLIDPGLVGVGAAAGAFVSWWAKATSIESLVVAPECQRILDLAPASFGAHILEDPGMAVSFWNLGDRRIERGGDGWAVGESVLKLFRFEGYDPEDPHLLSSVQGPRPRLLLSEKSDLLALASDYRQELLSEGYQEKHSDQGFDFLSGGLKVDKRMRSVYREALRKSFRNKESAPPNPFDEDHPADFLDWLNSADGNGRAPKVPRYLFELWKERLDLQIAFPGIAGADAPRFLEWVVNFGAAEVDLASELLVSTTFPEARASRGASLPEGLNIAGYFQAELGVGEMARLMLSAADKSGIPISAYSYRANHSRQGHPFESQNEGFVYDINLLCINADEFFPFVRDVGPHILRGRYTIGLWWWEIEDFPRPPQETLDLVDEVWVGSQHVAAAVSASTDKPVVIVPVPIRRAEAPSLSRSELGLPEGFMFLFTFDFLSIFERKNPVGVIEAFKNAFSVGEGPVLAIKSINGGAHLQLLEKLRLSALGRADIRIIDGYLSSVQNEALLAACDCYVSLHRAEGYGLGMAEAMSCGKPIIATRYSGNLAFLDDQNSYLIDYKLATIPSGAGPYPKGAMWAEPDLDQAAEAMRKVFTDQTAAKAVGDRARQDSASLHTFQLTGDFINQRLIEIRKLKKGAAGSSNPPRVLSRGDGGGLRERLRLWPR